MIEHPWPHQGPSYGQPSGHLWHWETMELNPDSSFMQKSFPIDFLPASPQLIRVQDPEISLADGREGDQTACVLATSSLPLGMTLNPKVTKLKSNKATVNTAIRMMQCLHFHRCTCSHGLQCGGAAAEYNSLVLA